jgi:hypothetical protein
MSSIKGPRVSISSNMNVIGWSGSEQTPAGVSRPNVPSARRLVT